MTFLCSATMDSHSDQCFLFSADSRSKLKNVRHLEENVSGSAPQHGTLYECRITLESNLCCGYEYGGIRYTYFHHHNGHNDSKEHFLLFHYCCNEVQRLAHDHLGGKKKFKRTPSRDLQLKLHLKVQHTD